jgi:hypothetical protein
LFREPPRHVVGGNEKSEIRLFKRRERRLPAQVFPVPESYGLRLPAGIERDEFPDRESSFLKQVQQLSANQAGSADHCDIYFFRHNF